MGGGGREVSDEREWGSSGSYSLASWACGAMAQSAGPSEVSCLCSVGEAHFSEGLHGDHPDATDPHVDRPLMFNRSAGGVAGKDNPSRKCCWNN